MKRMTKEAKKEFSKAVDEVGSLIEQGSAPEEAVRKVAGDREYGEKLTEMLCISTNLGLQWKNLRSGENLDEKLASAPMTRTDELLEDLFGPADKRAQERETTSSKISAFYSRSVDDIVDSLKEEPGLSELCGLDQQKAASSDADTGKKLDERMRTAEKLAEVLEELKFKAGQLDWDIAQHIHKVARQLRTSGADFNVLEKKAMAFFGSDCQPYLDLLAQELGVEKRAECTDEYVAVDDSKAPWPTLKQGMKLITEVTRMQDKIAEADQVLQEEVDSIACEDETAENWAKWMLGREVSCSDPIKVAGAFSDLWDDDDDDGSPDIMSIRDMLQAREDTEELESGLPEKRREKEELELSQDTEELESLLPAIRRKKEKGELRKDIRDRRLQMFLGPATKLEELLSGTVGDEPTVEEVFTPEHEAEIQRIKTEALLNQFLSVDPVLSRKDPEEVVEAYNWIRTIRPDVIDNPPLLRSYILMRIEQSDRLEPSFVSEEIERGLEAEKLRQQIGQGDKKKTDKKNERKKYEEKE